MRANDGSGQLGVPHAGHMGVSSRAGRLVMSRASRLGAGWLGVLAGCVPCQPAGCPLLRASVLALSGH
jgi:hypothetical protein